MANTKPEITGTTHILPFDKLSEDEFERLSLWTVRREGFSNVEHLGASGSEQGRDIIALLDGAQWAFQCKRVKQFGFKTAEIEIEKILALPEKEQPAKYVFIASCNISANTRQQVRRTYPELEIEFWAETELDEIAKRHTDVLYEFFTKPGSREKIDRNRGNMLQLVWNTWIEGLLKESLYNEVLIELGIETKPDAVEYKLDKRYQMLDGDSTPVPPGTTMLDLFSKANGGLLILGEPGSGKTTLLLELCRLLIKRAKEDPLHPIPVVFNLSSWKPEHQKKSEQAFADWLVNELCDIYFVPNKIGRPWVENDELLLLLDGFDEVQRENREACLQSINDFRREHSIQLAICSRRQEYEELTAQFSLHKAVLIQPLTNQQVNEYLQAAGADFTNVNDALTRDPDLQKFVHTPLILSIIMLVYRNATNDELRALEVTSDYRKHLLNAYISKMFKRRSAKQRYTPKKTQTWLSWLAREMVERRQTLFFIEDIQPSWLGFSKRKNVLIIGLLGGLIYGFIFGELPMLGVAIAWALLGGVIVGSITEFVVEGLILVQIFGLIVGWISGLVIGLTNMRSDIKPTDKLTWAWKEARNWLIGGLFGGLFGLLISVFFDLLYFRSVQMLTYGLIGGLIGGLKRVTLEERITPGRGITSSLNNFILITLLGWLIFPLISVLMVVVLSIQHHETLWLEFMTLWFKTFKGGGLIGEQQIVILYDLLYLPFTIIFVGMIVSYIVGLIYGGSFLISHLISCWLLYRSGNIPRNLVNFLDYCIERIFLRKIGGGYIFVHRMLMEHFAEMEFDEHNQSS